MNSEQGELLLYRRAKTLADFDDEEIKKRLQTETEAERTAVKNLVAEFDGLPLALNLAGAYIHRFGTNFAEYEDIYLTSAPTLLAEQDVNDQYQKRNEKSSVALAFSLAYQEIARPENDTDDAKQVAETAVLFLKTASFLFPEAMPLEIFTEMLAAQNEDLSKDKMFFNRVFAKIAQFDLFEKDSETKTFETHRIVQLVIYNKIEADEKTELCSKILEILSDLFSEYDYFNKPLCERFFRQTETVLEKSEKLNLAFENQYRLYNRCAVYQRLLGNFTLAEKFYQLELESGKSIFGENTEYTATSLNNLALVYRLQGKYEEAFELYKQALLIDEQTIGKEHPDYATRLNNLAGVYQLQGKYEEAFELFKQALLIGEQTIGKEHPAYATRLSNLADVYRLQGKYEEAFELYKQALLIDEQTIGKEHPDYATRLNNLADVYRLQGKYDEAVELFKQALLIDEQTIGKEHPNYAIRLNNLAGVYQLQGKYDEAVELYKQALLIDEQTVGKEHPNYAIRLNNLALVYESQGKYDEALPMYEEAVRLFIKFLGENHPSTLTVRGNLESCRVAMKNKS